MPPPCTEPKPGLGVHDAARQSAAIVSAAAVAAATATGARVAAAVAAAATPDGRIHGPIEEGQLLPVLVLLL